MCGQEGGTRGQACSVDMTHGYVVLGDSNIFTRMHAHTHACMCTHVHVCICVGSQVWRSEENLLELALSTTGDLVQLIRPSSR